MSTLVAIVLPSQGSASAERPASDCARASAALTTAASTPVAPLLEWKIAAFEATRHRLEACEKSRNEHVRSAARDNAIRVDLLEAYYYRTAAIAAATASSDTASEDKFKIAKSAALAHLRRVRSALGQTFANSTNGPSQLALQYESYLGQVSALDYVTFRRPAVRLDLKNGAKTLGESSCANANAATRVTRAVPPEYPDSAREQGATGSAYIGVSLDAASHVTAVGVLRSAGNAALDFAAIDAARASTYLTEIRNCVPIASRYVFRADFRSS